MTFYFVFESIGLLLNVAMVGYLGILIFVIVVDKNPAGGKKARKNESCRSKKFFVSRKIEKIYRLK